MSLEEKVVMKRWKLWAQVVIGGISVAMWTGTWAVAMNYTTLTRAYLLSNCQPLILVLFNKCTGQPVTRWHVVGVALGFIGLVTTSTSGLIGEGLHFSLRELIGDIVAFAGSVFAAIYIIVGGRVRTMLPAFVYMLPMTIVSIIVFIICTLTIESSAPSSLFSWIKLEYLPEISWLAIVTGLLGVALLIVIMKHLPSLIISIVLLFEPIAASIMAIIVGVESMPNAMTWVGAALVTLGIISVTIGYGKKTPISWIQEKILRTRWQKSNRHLITVQRLQE